MRFIYSLFMLLLLQVSCYAGDLREDVTISFANPDGTKTENLKTEIARTDPERSKGLMYRRDLKDGTGMFFIMPDETIQSFWMKNTYLSLDMVFIAKNGEVVSILRNVPPLTLNPRKSTGPAKFILELGAGSAEKLGVIEGSRVVLVEDGGGFLQGYF